MSSILTGIACDYCTNPAILRIRAIYGLTLGGEEMAVCGIHSRLLNSPKIPPKSGMTGFRTYSLQTENAWKIRDFSADSLPA